MPEILIVYASTHGHTGTIATHIAKRLEAAGTVVDVVEVEAAGDADPWAYDAVVLGGSVHMGHHRAELVDWARHHAIALNARPSAFFSVCLAVSDGTQKSRDAARDWIDDFQDDTGWTPERTASFAGALQYREYDTATRFLMRLMMARGGHPTDIRTDVEYTDWDAVDAFADAIAAMAMEGAQVP